MKDFFHHLFIPRESNNFRAKILHHTSLLLIIAGLLFGQLFLAGIKDNYQGVLGISSNISSQDLLSLTNQKRQENNLGPLLLNDQLSVAAQLKGQNMFAKNYWAHNAPDGVTPWVFIKAAGYEYIYAGENLARGFTTSSDVINAWMASPGHRENMLSPNYTDVGFSIAEGSLTGEDTILVVEMFGSRNSPSTTKEIATLNNQQNTLPSISPAVSAVVTITPTIPEPSPTQIIQQKPARSSVAAVKSEPLVEKQTFSKIIVAIVILLFIFVLALDIIVIKRKNIERVVAHNIDHIIFFGMILLIIILLRGGVIL